MGKPEKAKGVAAWRDFLKQGRRLKVVRRDHLRFLGPMKRISVLSCFSKKAH